MMVFYPKCKRCGEEKAWGPFISSEVWETQIPSEFRHGRLCRDCMGLYVDSMEFKRYDEWTASLGKITTKLVDGKFLYDEAAVVEANRLSELIGAKGGEDIVWEAPFW